MPGQSVRQKKKREAKKLQKLQKLQRKEEPPRRRWVNRALGIPVDGEVWADKLTSTQLKGVNMYIYISGFLLQQGFTTGELLDLIHRSQVEWEQYLEAYPEEVMDWLNDKTSPYPPPPPPARYSPVSNPITPAALDDHGDHSLNPVRQLVNLAQGKNQKKNKKTKKTKKKKTKKLKN